MIFEQVEAEVPHRVPVSDLVDLLVGQMLDGLEKALGHLRPERIRMRIVALVGDHILANVLDAAQAKGIVDEAVEEMTLEGVARLLVLEDGVGPNLVTAVGEVGALEEIRYPADAALRQGNA